MGIRTQRALLSGTLVAFLGLAVALTPFGTALEERFGLDNLFRFRGERPPPTEAVVVTIDEATARAIGAPKQLDRWSRVHHARLVENLKSLGAEAIAFDILFSEPHDEAGDAAFAGAMRDAGNVAITYMITRDQRPLGTASNAGLGAVSIEQRHHPLERLSDAAAAVSPFVLPKVPEPVRRYWTFHDDSVPSLPVTVLRLYGLREYQAWRELWQKIDPGYAATLPPRIRGASSRKSALRMYDTLAARLEREPHVAERMLGALEPGSDAGKTLRALIAVHADDTDRVLNFYGGPGTVEMIPYDRLSGESARSREYNLEGKVVFVGFAGRSVQAQDDGFLTVFSRDDGRDLAGVEIAATAFSNLLGGDWIRPLAVLPYSGLILLWGLAAGALFAIPGAARSLVAAIALGAGWLAATYYSFIAYYLWLPSVVPLLLQLPAAYVLALAWRYRESSRGRRRLKHAFSHYVPPEVVHRYGDEGGDLTAGGKVMTGICLFSDAAQYTRLAESLDPAALGMLVNDYYNTVFTPVRREGGIISDVVGDAMMGLWAAEQADPALASHACTAALAIARETTREARQGLPHGLPTRIGLDAGEILLGNVGAGDHYEYRAVGDTVNTATRIEGLNKLLGTRVLATQAVVEDARAHMFRPVGRFMLVGKSRATNVYQLLCPELDAELLSTPYLERYREGVAAFEAADWEGARERFARLLQERPQDGPSRYFLSMSEEFIRRPPSAWDGVIHLRQK